MKARLVLMTRPHVSKLAAGVSVLFVLKRVGTPGRPVEDYEGPLQSLRVHFCLIGSLPTVCPEASSGYSRCCFVWRLLLCSGNLQTCVG